MSSQSIVLGLPSAAQVAANTAKIGAGAITALNGVGAVAADLVDAENARWDPLTSFLMLAQPMPNSATVNTMGTWYASLITGSGTSPAKLVGPGLEPVCSHGRATGTTVGSISFAAANGQACISQGRAFRMAITSYVLVPTTNWRWWQGLMAGVPSNVDISTITHCVLIGKADGLANVQLVHNDGGGAGVMVDLGANFPANAVGATYRLALVFSSGTYYYRVTRLDTGDVASGSFSTRVPAAGLQWVAGCSNNTDALSAQIVWQGFRCQVAA